MEIRDFIVLFIAVSLLINVAFIMVPAVNRSCEAIPDIQVVTRSVELDDLRDELASEYISVTNNKIYAQTGNAYLKTPYNYATNSAGVEATLGTLNYAVTGFTSTENKLALLVDTSIVFVNVHDTGLDVEFISSSNELSGETIGIAMSGNYLFTHASDGTINKYTINRADSRIQNHVVMGNVGTNVIADISTSGNKLYTMSSNGSTLYQYTIGPNSIFNQVSINVPDNTETIEAFTIDGNRLFIKESRYDKIQVYKITIAGDGATSWRDACIKSEAITQSSFRVIGIITLLVAVAAVVFAIKKLDLLG